MRYKGALQIGTVTRWVRRVGLTGGSTVPSKVHKSVRMGWQPPPSSMYPSGQPHAPPVFCPPEFWPPVFWPPELCPPLFWPPELCPPALCPPEFRPPVSCPSVSRPPLLVWFGAVPSKLLRLPQAVSHRPSVTQAVHLGCHRFSHRACTGR